MHGLIVPIIAIVVVVVLLAIVKSLPKGKGQDLPYEKQNYLFTPAERSFLGVLEQAVGDQFRIMGKVRLMDIVKVKGGLDGKAKQTAKNKIQSKHVDFVACDPNDLSVQFVVELDDKSHEREDRQERDALVDGVMNAAGIPIVHFPVQRTYSIQEVRDALIAKLNPPAEKMAPVTKSVPVAKPVPAPAKASVTVTVTKAPPEPTPVQDIILDADGTPECPSCGGNMVRRKAKSGQNAGNEFWGCSNYPKCRGIMAIG